MCNAEFMVYTTIVQKTLEEQAKSEERKSIRNAAGLARSAENLRRTQEEAAVVEWADEETRKIRSAQGATAVVAGAAGVDIEVLTEQWTQAQAELFGARSALRRKHAAAGDIREHEIQNLKQQRLQKTEAAGAFEWALGIGQAFVQGLYMEHKIFGTTDKTFGIDTSDWFQDGEIDTTTTATTTDQKTEDPTKGVFGDWKLGDPERPTFTTIGGRIHGTVP